MKIQITECTAVGPQFANITPGSIHEVIDNKYSQYNGRVKREGKYLEGYWIQGVGEKVVVLVRECIVIK